MTAPGARATVLCRLDEIPSPGSKGFAVSDGPERCGIFVVRAADGVHAYVNSCPHLGIPLDWVPDRFLTLDRTLIQCATHGAQFRINDGRCIFGPCRGASLSPVAVAVRDGAVVLVGGAGAPGGAGACRGAG